MICLKPPERPLSYPKKPFRVLPISALRLFTANFARTTLGEAGAVGVGRQQDSSFSFIYALVMQTS